MHMSAHAHAVGSLQCLTPARDITPPQMNDMDSLRTRLKLLHDDVHYMTLN